MHKKSKHIILISVLTTIFVLTPTNAQVGIDVRSGYFQEDEELFLGAGLIFDLLFFTVNPNFEYVFVKDGDFYTINLDGKVTVLPLAIGSGWLGAGILYFSRKFDLSSDNGGGLNLLAGFGFDKLPLKPFAQLKYIFTSPAAKQFVFGLGIRF